MSRCAQAMIWVALVTACAAGCGDQGPPGGGLTNGPEPVAAPENPAVRTDVPPPDIPNKDDAPGQAQAPAAASPAPAPGSDASKESP